MVILYEKTATAADWDKNSPTANNGLCVLNPSSCIVHEVAGGQYELELEHPMDDGRFELLVEERIIKAPVPKTDIPQTTLPELIEWKVTAATASLYSKVPSTTHKNKNWKIIKAAKDNATAYAFRGYHTYNIGAVAIDGGYVYRAKSTVLGIAPSSATGSGYWEKLGSLDDAEPSHNAGTVIETLSQNDVIYKIADVGDHIRARAKASGKVGFIDKDSCAATQTRKSEVLPAQTITEQVFRIYEVSCDEETNLYVAKAKHISYDFAKNCLYDCKVTNVEPNEAISAIQGALAEDDSRTVATNITGTKISEDWSFKNPINALLDPDSGIVGKTNAKLIRNNGEIYILDSGTPRQGITIAYGVNMLGVNWRRSLENAVTRIIPRSGSADKGFTYISNGGRIYWDSVNNKWAVQNQGKDYVESSVADEFAVKRIVPLNCSYQVGQKYKKADGDDATYDEATVLEKMLTDAMEQFTINGADGADIELDVEFLLLGDTEEYKQYKGLQNVNLYDIIPIRTGKSRINSTAQVTEYEYDCLRNRYNSIKLGKINSFNKRVAGYRVVNGSISYDKLAPELIDRIVSQNASGSEDSNPSWETSTGGSYPTMAPNTRDTDGIVTKGYGNAGKVWKTDDQGNPGWRDEATVSGYIPESEKGAANGVATLDGGGKVPSNQLPSYVDDVLEYANKASFPATGEAGKIYVAKDTGKTYRWSGSAYVELSSYDEATSSSSGLMSASDKAKLDGIEAQANKYVLPQATSSALGGIKIGWTGSGKDYPVELDSNGKAHVAVPWTDTTYTLPLAANGTRGGVQIGYTQSGKNYPVQLSGEKMYVNVPWTADGGNAATVNGKTVAANVPADAKFTDHEYTAGTGLSLSNGQFSVRLAYTTSGKNYKVQADNSGNLYVNVPWTDNNTTYSAGTGISISGTNNAIAVQTGYTTSGKNYAVQAGTGGLYVNVPWTDTTYTLPLAANGTRGGVQIGFTTDATNRNYAVQLSSEKMYVNVPWQNTWRGIQDNLTSTSTTDSLSAKQGKTLQDTKVAKAGDTMTGNLYVQKSGTDVSGLAKIAAKNSTSQLEISMSVQPANYKHGLYSSGYYNNSTYHEDGKYLIYRDSDGEVKLDGGYTVKASVPVDAVFTDVSGNNRVLRAGDAMTGTLTMNTANDVAFDFRDYAAYHTTISYQTFGNEALVFATKNSVTSFIFVNNEDSITNHGYNRWTSLTPGLQIKENCVRIGGLWGSGTTPDYKLRVDDSAFFGGHIDVERATEAHVSAKNTTTGIKVAINAGSSGTNHGLESFGYYNGSSYVSDVQWMVYRNSAGHTILNGSPHVEDFGSVASMDALKTKLCTLASGWNGGTQHFCFLPTFTDTTAGFYNTSYGEREGVMYIRDGNRFTCVITFHKGIITKMANDNGTWTISKEDFSGGRTLTYFGGHSNGSTTNNFINITFPSSGHAIVAIGDQLGCLFLAGNDFYYTLPSGYGAQRTSGTNEVQIRRSDSSGTVFYVHGIFLRGTSELPVSNGT